MNRQMEARFSRSDLVRPQSRWKRIRRFGYPHWQAVRRFADRSGFPAATELNQVPRSTERQRWRHRQWRNCVSTESCSEAAVFEKGGQRGVAVCVDVAADRTVPLNGPLDVFHMLGGQPVAHLRAVVFLGFGTCPISTISLSSVASSQAAKAW